MDSLYSVTLSEYQYWKRQKDFGRMGKMIRCIKPVPREFSGNLTTDVGSVVKKSAKLNNKAKTNGVDMDTK